MGFFRGDLASRATVTLPSAAGFSDFSRWCLDHGWAAIGHCIGLDIHEQPGLSATCTALLKENMVLCAEPYITLGGTYPFWEAKEKYGIEDVVLVTKDGAEILTPEEDSTHDLWVV
mgnify:CR=1 FL=1